MVASPLPMTANVLTLTIATVAFFPLGHPVPGSPEVRVKASAKTGIQTILESLMRNAEGED